MDRNAALIAKAQREIVRAFAMFAMFAAS